MVSGHRELLINDIIAILLKHVIFLWNILFVFSIAVYFIGKSLLQGAVIAPSDEDSVTFSVNAANGDLFKLRGEDMLFDT